MAEIRVRESGLNMLLLTEIDIEVSTPNRRIGVIVDTNLQPHSGQVAIGKGIDGYIIVGIQTTADFQFGFQLTASQAKMVADIMREVADAT